MIFTPVDLDSWERRSHYEYYTKLLKCGYSVTVSLDITKLHRQVKEKGLRFYPVFVYCVSRQIAATKEFRMGRDSRRTFIVFPWCHGLVLPDILRIRRAEHRCCSRSLPAENLQSGMDG